MASFDFSKLAGIGTSGTDYSYLLTQLDIKENQLASDGNLSPGDYDLLTKTARDAYAHPGLTPAQRNQINVKISGYQKDKSTQTISRNSDVTSLNNDVKDTMAQATMLRGNDPAGFLQAKSDTLAAKLSQLKESIDTADASGADSSGLTNEFGNALSEYNETTSALQDVKAYAAAPTGKPTSNFAAYLTTNSKGEITDVQVGRQGSISGYSEVMSLYGGLPIYAKPNTTTNGQKTFLLGNQQFMAPSYAQGDNGTTITPPLVSVPLGTTKAPGNSSKNNRIYIDMDSSATRPQGMIPDGGWAQGKASSTFYQNNGGGKYTKHINADPQMLGIPSGGFIQIPNAMEQSLAPAVGTTTDHSAPLVAPTPNSAMPNTSSTPPVATSGTPGPSSSPLPSASRTQAPVSRSPQTFGGIVQQANSSVGGFLKSLFSGGK